jgi:hypothetical protein
MRLPIDLEKLRHVDVSVPLRGGKTHVPQKFLNGAQIGAGLEQGRGEGMPQRVRTDAKNACCSC